jgi:hypothetical protein
LDGRAGAAHHGFDPVFPQADEPLTGAELDIAERVLKALGAAVELLIGRLAPPERAVRVRPLVRPHRPQRPAAREGHAPYVVFTDEYGDEELVPSPTALDVVEEWERAQLVYAPVTLRLRPFLLRLYPLGRLVEGYDGRPALSAVEAFFDLACAFELKLDRISGQALEVVGKAPPQQEARRLYLLALQEIAKLRRKAAAAARSRPARDGAAPADPELPADGATAGLPEGDDWDMLEPLVRRLLHFMRGRERADLAALCPVVWGRDYADVSGAALSTAVSKANAFLRRRESRRVLEKPRGEACLRWA